MRRVVCLLLALSLALAAGCAPEEMEQQEELVLWFAVDQSLREVPSVALETQPYQGARTIPDLMQALLDGPGQGSGLISAIPSGTQLLEWTMEGEVAYIDLSQPYGDLVGVDLTMADYCIALTLGRRKGICPLYPLACTLFTLAAVFLVYNQTAWPYCIVALACSLAGDLIGAAMRKMRN